MPTFLHLSDLHRYKADEVSNATLINGLISDFQRVSREDRQVGEPDGAVISGDLVRGLAPGEPGYPDDLAGQYDQALEFLRTFTAEFFNGDAAKVVIAPGNHDVDWTQSKAAMVEVAEKEIAAQLKGDLEWALESPEMGFRWDWKARKLMRINDARAYESRFRLYNETLGNFYRGAALPLPYDPTVGHRNHIFCDRRIVVTAFNSCDQNDCFNRTGHIRTEDIEQASIDCRSYETDLNIAVWHHDIEGNPRRSDYLDIDTVRRLIDRGYQLGLHGHDHKSSVSPVAISPVERVTFASDEMVVIGAGSLGADFTQLPPGHLRQYNVVILSEDFRSGRVLVREMEFPGIFQGRREIALTIPFGLKVRGRDQVVDASRSGGRAISSVEQIDWLIVRGRFSEALSRLESEGVPDPYGRQLRLRALMGAKYWQELVRAIGEPSSSSELITLVQAYTKLREWGAAEGALARARVSGICSPGILTELERRVSARRAIEQ